MIVNIDTHRIVAKNPRTALTVRMRLIGLMGKHFSRLDYDALIFGNCASIHTCFMRMPIDVLFLDRENAVIAMKRALPPWRLCLGGRRAFWTVELPAGSIDAARCEIGHRLNMNMELTGAALLSLRGTLVLPEWGGVSVAPESGGTSAAEESL